jgi:hypothetical protein
MIHNLKPDLLSKTVRTDHKYIRHLQGSGGVTREIQIFSGTYPKQEPRKSNGERNASLIRRGVL